MNSEREAFEAWYFGRNYELDQFHKSMMMDAWKASRKLNIEVNECQSIKFYEVTLLDYFAVNALNGMISDSKVDATPSKLAQLSYLMADAMLEARK